MARRIELKNITFVGGNIHFFFDDGKEFEATSIINGVMTVKFPYNYWLKDVAEIVIDCFGENSGLNYLDVIEFEYQRVKVSVKKQNATIEQITEMWRDGIATSVYYY